MIDARFNDDATWQDTAGYSRAVRSGSHIAVSGTTASAPDGAPIADDTYAQTLDALRRGVGAVEELGGRIEDVTRTRLYLTPQSDWTGAARAHREVFDAVRPANTTLFVAALVGDGLLVEAEMEAITTAVGAGGGHPEVSLR